MRSTKALAAALLPLLLATAVGACGGDDPAVEPAEQQPAGDTASLHHIHGLGVAAENDTLRGSPRAASAASRSRSPPKALSFTSRSPTAR
jgi:hypothetical protein